MSSRDSPIAPMILVRSSPARPTNGLPCLSSSAPGASPTNISSAFGFPTPKTVCVRKAARCSHLAQVRTASRSALSRASRGISDLKFDDYGINTEDVHSTDIIKTGLVEDFSESNFFPKDETFFFNNEGTEQKSEIEHINSFTNFKKNLVLDNASQKNEENQIIDKSRKSSDIDLGDENYIRLFIGNIVADQETVSKMLNDIVLSLEEDISLLSSEGADCFDALNYRKALYIAKYGDRLQRFRSKLLDLKADWDDQDFIFDIDSEIFD